MTVIETAQTNKDKILEAASEIFLQGGVSALSVRAIAARAGVSTIGIYSHFKGKDGLLEALYIEGFEMVSKAMEVDDRSDPRGSVVAACGRYLDIAENHKAHYQLIFGEAGAGYEPSAAARVASATAFERLVSFTSIVLPPESSLADKQKKALEVWALMHGFVSLRHHAVAEALPCIDWRALVLGAVEKFIDA